MIRVLDDTNNHSTYDDLLCLLTDLFGDDGRTPIEFVKSNPNYVITQSIINNNTFNSDRMVLDRVITSRNNKTPLLWYRVLTDEQMYLGLMRETIKGDARHFKPVDRTGVGTWSTFGRSLRFDLRNGRLPMLTTKKMFFKGIAKELLWFLKGDCTNTDALLKDNVHIWDGNSSRAFLDSRGLSEYAEGELGPVYGYQWRHWGKPYVSQTRLCRKKTNTTNNDDGIDQIRRIIDTLRNIHDHPHDQRRMILSAWNVSDLDQMALPPCHMMAQFYIREEVDINNNNKKKKLLSCAMYQRSADLFLGVPFNITSYALLTHMIAHAVPDCEPHELIMMFGDAHVYANHVEQVNTQLERFEHGFDFPTLKIVNNNNVRDIDQIRYEDFVVEGYRSHDAIRASMAV